MQKKSKSKQTAEPRSPDPGAGPQKKTPPAGAPTANPDETADLTKVDPSLWKALEQPETVDAARLPVFLRLDPTRAEAHAEVLSRVGLEEPISGTRVPVTANLTPREVKLLSREPAVAYIRLAATRRPTDKDPS